MIKISSFSPLQNFSRWVWEFYDDKLVIKTKSITMDYDRDVKYEKIKSIQNKRTLELGWLRVSFTYIVLLGLISLGLDYFCITNPIIEAGKKIAVILALMPIIPAFGRNEYYSFLDKDNNLLATVRVNKKNKQTLLEAIQLIKQKTKITSETYFDDSLPSTPPVFQFTEFDFADFLNISKVSVYEDRIIDVEKSLAEEVTTVIRYDELSGETKFAKIGNEKWVFVWSYWLYFVCVTGISVSILFAEQIKGNYLFLNLFFGGLVLIIPLFFLQYIKSEILIFHDKQDNGIFWTRVNSANREKLNHIVEFIKGKLVSEK